MDQVSDDQRGEPNLYQPGQSISPSAGVPANIPPEQPAPTDVPTAALVEPFSAPAPAQLAAPSSEPDVPVQPHYSQPLPEQVPATQYSEPVLPAASGGQQYDTGDTITWTASEFIDHQKTASWYLGVGVAAVFGAALVWLVTRDFFPATAVFIGLVLLGVYGARKPHEESYALDAHGLTIGNRRYLYSDFRSFTVVPEGAFLSVELTPLKRFAMYVTMYFDPADEDKILDRLSEYLPMTEPRNSLTDGLMRRIHF